MTNPNDPAGHGPNPAERAGRTRVGDGGSPVGSPLTIVLAVVAVVVGFLIFRTIDSGGGSALDIPTTVPGGTAPGATTPEGGTAAATTVPGATAPATTVAPSRTGATVVVINAGEVSGSAGQMTDLLAQAGYTMEPGVSDNDSDQAETTVVQFLDGTGNPATEAVARSVAADLGGVAVAATATAPAVNQGDSVGAATVFVLLGTDKANSTLAPAAPATPTAPSIAAPSTTSAG